MARVDVDRRELDFRLVGRGNAGRPRRASARHARKNGTAEAGQVKGANAARRSKQKSQAAQVTRGDWLRHADRPLLVQTLPLAARYRYNTSRCDRFAFLGNSTDSRTPTGSCGSVRGEASVHHFAGDASHG